MKFQKFAFAALLTAVTSTAFAEGYVGAGSGGPLMSTNGCVMSANGMSFPECGGASPAEASKPAVAPQPRTVTRVIVDCSKCGQAQRPKAAAKPQKPAARKLSPQKPMVKKSGPKPVVRYGNFRKYKLRPKK